MPCHSYRTTYDDDLLRGECDCGWTSEPFRTPLALHAVWYEHAAPPRRRPSSPERGVG